MVCWLYLISPVVVNLKGLGKLLHHLLLFFSQNIFRTKRVIALCQWADTSFGCWFVNQTWCCPLPHTHTTLTVKNTPRLCDWEIFTKTYLLRHYNRGRWIKTLRKRQEGRFSTFVYTQHLEWNWSRIPHRKLSNTTT